MRFFCVNLDFLMINHIGNSFSGILFGLGIKLTKMFKNLLTSIHNVVL